MQTTVTATRSSATSGELAFTTPLAPERAFDYVADLTKHPEWSDELLAVEEEGAGPCRAGKEYRLRDAARLGASTHIVAHARVTTYERPRLVAWEMWTEAEHGLRAMRSRWSFEVAPEGTGSRITQRYAFEPPDALSRTRLRAWNAIGDLMPGGAGSSPKVLLRRAEQLRHVLDVRSAVDHL